MELSLLKKNQKNTYIFTVTNVCFQMQVESGYRDEAVSGACCCKGRGWNTVGETLPPSLEGGHIFMFSIDLSTSPFLQLFLRISNV